MTYAQAGPKGREAIASDRAEEHMAMAAERYDYCRRAARAGDLLAQKMWLGEADRQAKLAEEWMGRAVRDRIDIMAAELKEVS